MSVEISSDRHRELFCSRKLDGRQHHNEDYKQGGLLKTQFEEIETDGCAEGV
jgi:hypothetical protein